MSLHNGLILGLLVGSSPYHTPSVSKIKNVGNWQPEEAREYDKYVEYMDFIAFMRLKARSLVSTLPNM